MISHVNAAVEYPAGVLRAWRRVWLGLPALIIAVFCLELCLGSVFIGPGKVLAILLGDGAAPEAWQKIVLLFRLPRAFTAMLAGAALGMAGLQMQTLFRNPLADPSVLGINSGASLGVALVVLATGDLNRSATMAEVSGSGMALVLAASAGSLAVMALVLIVARRIESNLTLLIVGLMLAYFTSSAVTVLMSFAHELQLQRYVGWTFGSFGGVTWGQLQILTPVLAVGLVASLALAKSMNAMLLGTHYASSLGANVRRIRVMLTLSASGLAGTVTAYCGPIGFLGIAAPQIARSLMRTSDHRVLLPCVLAAGALMAMVADLAAQLPGSALALPLNAVTSIIGAPIVLSMILRRKPVLELEQ